MAEVFNTVKAKINEVLDSNPKLNDPVTKIADKLKMEKPIVVLAAAALPFFLLLLWGNGGLAVDLVGYVYPVFLSIKAIESGDKEDNTLLLTYWFIFTLFKVLEGVIGYFFSNIPFFFLMKSAFLVYLYHPKTKGAFQVYNNVIKPFIVPHLGLEGKEKESKKDN